MLRALKYIRLNFSLVMILMIISGISNAEVTGFNGSGTETDPYTISSTEELDFLASQVNNDNNYAGKYFRLDDNITYITEGLNDTDSNFTAIGKGNNTFKGIFNGNGYKISGIRIYQNETERQGLFGYIGQDGCVKNVILTDTIITGSNYTGAIAGSSNNGKIENCFVSGDVVIHGASSSGHTRHGGICGYNDQGSITGCISAAKLTQNTTNGRQYGGIAGQNQFGTITDCIYLGSILQGGAEDTTGAITGKNNSTITNCYYITDAFSAGGGTLLYTITPGTSINVSGALTPGEYSGSGVLGYNGKYYALDGTEITLNFSEIYTGSYSVKTNDESVTVSNNIFTMPAGNVTASYVIDISQYWGNNDGSENLPYTITAADGLNLLAFMVNDGNNYNGKYFILGNDITYHTEGESNFTSIGTSSNPFSGNFDGKGHKITGIRVIK